MSIDTMTRRIPVSTVIQELREIVVVKGEDHVYTKSHDRQYECVYFTEDGQPDCIVGHWFARHGLGPDQVEEGASAGVIAYELGLVDASGSELLVEVQEKQDGGHTWGDALHLALERHNERLNVEVT